MADLLSSFSSIAMSTGAEQWILIGINIIISTIVTGIAILIIAEIMSKTSGEPINLANAFLAALLINIVNYVIGIGILGGLLYTIPYIMLIFPLVVWIGAIKLFFSGFTWMHVLIVAIACFIVSIMIVPLIVNMVSGMIMANMPI